MHSMSNEIVIIDLHQPNQLLAVLRQENMHFNTFIVMPIPNLPALLIIGCYDGLIYIFRLDGTKFPCLHTLKDHTDIVTGFALSASSSNPQTSDERCLFASSSTDCTVRLWNALTGECLSVFRGKYYCFHTYVIASLLQLTGICTISGDI